MNNIELVHHFECCGVITRGNFIGKSGTTYSIETDLRNALATHKSAKETAQRLVEQISKLVKADYAFIGVPETGSVLAFYLNEVLANNGVSFSPNMIRSVPKDYQVSTNSVVTVLPMNSSQKYILVEDDVVTGNTLCKYLKSVKEAGLNIIGVVSVFGRNSATAVHSLCKEYCIPYYELININVLEGEV